MTTGYRALAITNLHNLHAVYSILIITGLDIGRIVILASIITAIICPNNLIITVATFTLTIHVLGSAIGYPHTTTSSTISSPQNSQRILFLLVSKTTS